jgi:CIC family chloride channel protein
VDRPGPPSGRTGFDVAPARPPAVTFLLFLIVVLLASTTAHVFKIFLRNVIRFYSDRTDPTTASAHIGTATLFVLATAGVLVAAAIGSVVQRRWPGRFGIEAVAASARGDDRSISFRATVLRVVATFTVSAGLVSIGRESAIVESGGVTGAVVGRESGGRGDALASAGIAAAFASAYNAPIAAMLYAEEHLRIRRSARASVFVVAGAIAGQVLTVWLFHGEAVFPDLQGSVWRVVPLGLVVLVPTVLVSKSFLYLRVRVTADSVSRRTRWPRGAIVAAFAVAAGVSVAAFPLASGNGMEALQRGPVAATTSLGVALVVGKLVGTTAALGAGAPGGVLSPTMGVAGGTALLVSLVADSLGLGIANPWDAMVVAMAIGVAVGMRSPLVAIFLIPELLGDYSLVLPVGVVVGAAWLADRALDRLLLRSGAAVPTGIYDEDA